MFQSEITAITYEGAVMAIKESEDRGKVVFVPGYAETTLIEQLEAEYQPQAGVLVKMVRSMDCAGYFFRWTALAIKKEEDRHENG
jgi:hypothetical protein